MINSVTLIGRLTKDPELRKSQQNKSVIRFTLAVDRPFRKDQTDFIQCVVWNQNADFLAKYVHKGDLIGLTGRIETGSYQRNGETVYTTDVVADQVSLISKKKEENVNADSYEPPMPEKKVANAMKVGDDWVKADDLPFY